MLLSIVIATKNRVQYCIAAIESILKYNYPSLEICISDNSDTQELKHFVESLNSTAIRYKYQSTAISSISNFNEAMELAIGEYVFMIGDDDSILPTLLQVAEWAHKNDIDSVSANHFVHYYWPGARVEYPTGGLLQPQDTDTRVEFFDCSSVLKKLLGNGLVNYVFYPVPKSYHGLVKRSLMLKVKSMTGAFYGGLSPDIYAVVSLSLLIKTHAEVNQALSIAGVCRTSTTADNFRGGHAGALQNAPHLKHRGPYHWLPNVPEYYSVTTLWAESGLRALLDMNQVDYMKQFSPYRMLAQGLFMNRNSILKYALAKTDEFRVTNRKSKLPFYSRVLFGFIGLVIEKVTVSIRTKKLNIQAVMPVSNIEDAIALCSNNKFRPIKTTL